MKITILTDSERSWFVTYGKKLKEKLTDLGHIVYYVFSKKDIVEGDICFLLSCSKLVDENTLIKNKYNIVIHASDLPKGKGFSPLQWQILEGKNEIILSLFEVVKEVDAGQIYFKESVSFNGNELYEDLRKILADKIIEMCIFFIENIEKLNPTDQRGKGTLYRRRTIKDDEINISKSIKSQFNHFRIADNKNHPLWFSYEGCKYIVKIYKKND